MLTGRQYKESLKDGRRVYFEGRLIEDFGSEPAMAIPLQAIADGYDKYYSAEPGAVNPLTIAPAQRRGTARPHPGHHRDGPPAQRHLPVADDAAAGGRAAGRARA